MAPGVAWPDMQTLAYRSLLTKLKEGGLLTCVAAAAVRYAWGE